DGPVDCNCPCAPPEDHGGAGIRGEQPDARTRRGARVRRRQRGARRGDERGPPRPLTVNAVTVVTIVTTVTAFDRSPATPTPRYPPLQSCRPCSLRISARHKANARPSHDRATIVP